jgi:hypothetical protein
VILLLEHVKSLEEVVQAEERRRKEKQARKAKQIVNPAGLGLFDGKDSLHTFVLTKTTKEVSEK